MYICTYCIQIKIYVIVIGKGVTNCMTEVETIVFRAPQM